MKNIKFYIILFLGIILVFFSINIVLAQTTTDGDVNKVGGQSLPNLKVQAPGELLKNIYNFSLIISGLLAFGAIVYGGILRATAGDNTQKIKDSNDWIKSAVIGLILLFGAYIILNTINPNLLILDLPKLKEVETPPPSSSATGGGSFGVSEGKYSDAEARKLLSAAGINVKPTNTSLEGINKETLQAVVQMKLSCNCNFMITGGTEIGSHNSGEFSHANGYKVDIAMVLNNGTPDSNTQKLIDYFKRVGTPTTRLRGGTTDLGFIIPGNKFGLGNIARVDVFLETTNTSGPHFDIVVRPGPGSK